MGLACGEAEMTGRVCPLSMGSSRGPNEAWSTLKVRVKSGWAPAATVSVARYTGATVVRDLYCAWKLSEAPTEMQFLDMEGVVTVLEAPVVSAP